MLGLLFTRPSERACIRELKQDLQTFDKAILRINASWFYALFSYYIGGVVYTLTQGALCKSNLYVLVQERKQVVADLTDAQASLAKAVRRRAITTTVISSALAAIGYWYNQPHSIEFPNQHQKESSSTTQGAPKREVVWAITEYNEMRHPAPNLAEALKGLGRDLWRNVISWDYPEVLLKGPSRWESLQPEQRAELLLDRFKDWQFQSFSALSPKTMLIRLKALAQSSWVHTDSLGDLAPVVDFCKQLEGTFDDTSQCATDYCKQAKALVPVICPTEETVAVHELFTKSNLHLAWDRLHNFYPPQTTYGSYLNLPSFASLSQEERLLVEKDLKDMACYMSDVCKSFKQPTNCQKRESLQFREILERISHRISSNREEISAQCSDVSQLPPGDIKDYFSISGHGQFRGGQTRYFSLRPQLLTRAFVCAEKIVILFSAFRSFDHPRTPLGVVHMCQMLMDWASRPQDLDYGHAALDAATVSSIHDACTFALKGSSYELPIH